MTRNMQMYSDLINGESTLSTLIRFYLHHHETIHLTVILATGIVCTLFYKLKRSK